MRYRLKHLCVTAGIACVLMVALSAIPAVAHDPGLSTMSVKLLEQEIDLRMILTRRDAAMALGQPATADGAIEVWTGNRRLAAIESDVKPVGETELELAARFPRPTDARRLRVMVPLIAHLAHGHRQYVTVQDAAGATRATHLLDAADVEIEVELP